MISETCKYAWAAKTEYHTQFWRLEVQDQDGSMIGFQWGISS
jgi:hypothetical protein